MAPSSSKNGRRAHKKAAIRAHRLGYYCNPCAKKADRNGMDKHMEKKHKGNLQCSTCLFKASTPAAMEAHTAWGHTSTLSNETLNLLKIDKDASRATINEQLEDFGLKISDDEEQD